MSDGTTGSELFIAGMRDNACRERIAEALGRVEGVRDVSVSLLRGRAVVVHARACKPAELVHAVTNAGYAAVLDSRLNGPGAAREGRTTPGGARPTE